MIFNKKIVITGALGYIGTELCKLYSGESRSNRIIAIDKRHVSERVSQLRSWGIDFVQGDILDEEFVKSIVSDADIVYHFAGITDVAYTKAEENTQSEEITKVGIDGSRNLINCIPDYCRLIFPSTHVVYEGFKEAKKNITEDVPVCPELTYAKGKAQTEKDLQESDRNYVILRLASVYGYSTDTMRIGIMPNLFSKIASQNGTIKLFSGGVQLKSLVPLIDAARCFKFMGENTDINRETFHLSKENMTVKEVAELCKSINPNLTLIETDDEIPNLGYTISNKKLLETGFEFRYNLTECLEEMIENWSKKDIKKELEYKITGGKDYVDERGKISNYELPEPINLIGYIESKKGSMRANHYHPIQEQKCLLISGRYISVIKDLLDDKAPVQTQVINPGDIAVIKPNVAHTMVFLEDSVFLNLVRGEREHENYGITHTIPYQLVDEKLKNDLLENYSSKCRISDSKNLETIVSLGMSPLANNLLSEEDDECDMYPLEMVYCTDSHNCQLSYAVPANKMFDNYLYVSSTTKTFRDHFERAAEKYIEEFNLNKLSLVVDVGSNDGIALRPLKERGVGILGVEPAENIAKIARENGIMTANGYFDQNMAYRIIETYGHADLVTASNVFAHADDLKKIAVGAFTLLKEGGTFIVEVQYLLDTIRDLTFDNIYHEHVNYWSVLSISKFFESIGSSVVKVEHIDTHGGSIRVYVQKGLVDADQSVEKFIDEEKEYGLDRKSTYENFSERIQSAKRNVNKNISGLKKQDLSLAGYGSPAKATTALNYYGVTSSEIDYIIEDNPMKHGKFLPGVKIPIVSKEKLDDGLPDVIIVMAWNFFEDIKRNNKDLIDKGVAFVSIKDLQNNSISTCINNRNALTIT